MKHIYIALPYTHKEPHVRRYRYEQCLKYALELAAQGYGVISPVLMAHDLYELSLVTGVEIPYDFWVDVSDRAFKGADEVHLLKLEGWDKSTGVRKELDWAAENVIPVIDVEIS